MKKVKLFFVSAALMLLTVGVFAGRTKFVNSDIYYRNGANFTQIVVTSSMPGFTTSGTNIAKVVSSSNGTTQYELYTHNGSTYIPLYTSGF